MVWNMFIFHNKDIRTTCEHVNGCWETYLILRFVNSPLAWVGTSTADTSIESTRNMMHILIWKNRIEKEISSIPISSEGIGEMIYDALLND